MGLANVHRIVRAHSGVTSVKSEPGQGATFAIELGLYSSSLPAIP
jgi:signal transduction histidine kinase